VCVCECTVGVDVGDGTTMALFSIISNIVIGCIVLGRQMDVYFSTTACTNTTTFVGMDVRFCTMKIHDSITIYMHPNHYFHCGASCILSILLLYLHLDSTPHYYYSPKIHIVLL
jgi:predicted small secreted protein